MLLDMNCKGRLFTATEPVVMGILNATPDSFYTGGKPFDAEKLTEKAALMISDGARILDIGGMSTRPGAPAVSLQEELDRVLPVISSLRTAFPEIFISADTYRAVVAKEAVNAGADIINDISAGNMDPDMIATVAELGVPYILMHMQGTPADMQKDPVYQNITADILDFFLKKINYCYEAGIKDIVLDPGFGFGKTIAHNYLLLKELHTLRIAHLPLLAGLSRKSMIYRQLDIDAAAALNGTTALHMLALQQGAAILRVHDVREAYECIRLFSFYQTIQKN